MSYPLFDAMWEVGERVARTPHLLLCLNFDDTLAPSVEDPTEAYLSAQLQRVLRCLGSHENISVAILSGRDRADLQARVGIPGLIYAGNHGLEISGHGFIFVEPTAVKWRSQLQELAVNLQERLLAIDGVLVQDRGLSIGVHYRQAAPSAGETVRRIIHVALAEANHPFQLITEDMISEVRPRVYWDRGSAIVWIKDQIGKPEVLTVYVGDMAADEVAFEALRDDITVKVDGTSETAARYYMEGEGGVRKLLEWIESVLRERTACAASIGG